jgi:hypothetical protein
MRFLEEVTMSVVSAISQGSSSDAAGVDRSHASHRQQSRSVGPVLEAAPAESFSCEAYERLMAGEWVSWSQILQEHPMLGQITVTELVNAGVVRVEPVVDPATGQIDVRLSRRQADDAAPESGRGTWQRGAVEKASVGHARKDPAVPRGERKLKVVHSL